MTLPRLLTNAAAIRVKRRRIAPRRPGPSTEPKTVNEIRSEWMPRRLLNARTRGWLALPASRRRLDRRRRREVAQGGRSNFLRRLRRFRAGASRDGRRSVGPAAATWDDGVQADVGAVD